MINNFPITNIYEKKSKSSKLSSQMIYGEKFTILSKDKKWLKIKTNFDKYTGYIQNKKFLKFLKITNKVNKKRTKIFKKNSNNKFVSTKKFLYFGSRISIQNKKKNYVQFEENKWIKKTHLKEINHREKSISRIIKLFLNTKYLWGGKTSLGIDCSALIQIYFHYNGIFFHRDTKDQIRFLKIIPKKTTFEKNNLIFWKGHVAFCLNKNNLIHAYGPSKKVIIMKINKTIKEIRSKSKLSVRGIRKIYVK